MPTTSNFGWTTPADTDLVKDGAAAIRTLGNGIDTSFLDLKGGTTGQVLSKASNTDLDFSWVAQDDSNAIQNAIVDAKGDLISATAADTPARLAVGTNGQVLTADSTTATGLKWAAPSSGAVLQVVSANSTTSQTITSGTYVDVTGLSVTITPSSASNKIVIMMGADVGIADAGRDRAQTNYQILRGATVLTQSSAYHIGDDNEVYDGGYQGFIIYDSPATTSATTYKIQGKVATPASESQTWGDYAYIIAMEVV
tara:strand:- start:314 stop:1078 length:765 start_codon:yes stop_codon:yes gene_type:complete